MVMEPTSISRMVSMILISTDWYMQNWGGKTSWWQVQHGRCYHYDGTWYYEPGNYAANASGLWAIINGEAAFNVNGVYTVSRGYDMDMGVPSTTINYTYEVVNGLVTDMQVVVQQ